MNITLLIVYVALVGGILLLTWKARKEGARADENSIRLMWAWLERDRARERGVKIVEAWERLGYDTDENQSDLDAHIRFLRIELQHVGLLPFPPVEQTNDQPASDLGAS